MSPGPEIPIEDYLCLALYRASRAVTALYRELLADLGLTYPQYLVMRLLWQRGDQPVGAIAEALALDYGTLSPLLKRLEAGELIARTRSARDERSVTIAVTEAGRALSARSAEVPHRLNAALGLDESEARALRVTLARVTASVGASTANARV